MSQRKIGIILQARMGSTRLPGKVLRALAGKPMIQWIIERLQTCKKVRVLILATSTSDKDASLVELAEKLGVMIFRGSESDVLDRYYHCAVKYHLDDIVRATGDNPFVDPEACDDLIEFYDREKLDYAAVSTQSEDGFPLGVGVEIFSFAALRKSWQEGHEPDYREHVNEYILENPILFKQKKMAAPIGNRAPGVSLTVDTIEQFEVAEKIYMSYINHHSNSMMPVSWAINSFRRMEIPKVRRHE